MLRTDLATNSETPGKKFPEAMSGGKRQGIGASLSGVLYSLAVHYRAIPYRCLRPGGFRADFLENRDEVEVEPVMALRHGHGIIHHRVIVSGTYEFRGLVTGPS